MALGHKTLAAFYLQLAQNLDAGLPLAKALRGTAGPPRASLRDMAGWIEGGGSVEQAFRLARGWLPRAERPLLLAAATTGRLPSALRRLAERHTQLRSVQLKVGLTCAYPLFLFHLAALIFPVARSGLAGEGVKLGVGGYLATVAAFLLPAWGLMLGLTVLARRESPVLWRLAGVLPFFRGYSRAQALADFTYTLSNLLDAGIVIGQAWLIAGRTTRSPALRAAAQTIHDAAVGQGDPPGLNLPRFSCFPLDYIGLYRAGELNGQLDANLRLLGEQCHEHSRFCLQLAAKAYSTAVFLLVAVMVGYIVVTSYAGYFDKLNSLSNFKY